jgi:Ca-activated chloride channel family protein
MKRASIPVVVLLAILTGCFGNAPGPKVELQAPAELSGGSEFQVTWTGPDSVGDYITIVPSGAPEGDWAEYVYTADGNPVTLHAPYAPGQYEIRYATEKTTPDSTLARITLNVTAVQASLTAPQSAMAGSLFDVAWTGPANQDCYIYIVPVGTPEGDWAGSEWNYVSMGNPLPFTAPTMPGTYEIRFATETTEPDSTLAMITIAIEGGNYVLTAPAQVAAGASFDVSWVAPGASGEYIVVVPAGTPEGEWAGWEWRYVSEGSTLNFTAPQAPGMYEIRYSTEATDPNSTLTRIQIEVI